jgi:FkbM family methyltransferase
VNVKRIGELVNALPIGERSVRISAGRLYADSLDRYVAALAWKCGWLERNERDLIALHVRPGMVVVDVGANIGFHTLNLAASVAPSGRVYAIEPDPRSFRLLSRAVASAPASVRLRQAAAMNHANPVTLYVSAVNRGDHRVVPTPDERRQQIVPAVILDELLAGEHRVDFVKIDVQGAEVRVLDGLRQTLARNRDAIGVLCELCPALVRRSGADAEEFFRPLRDVGLVPHYVRRKGLIEPVDERAVWGAAEASGYLNVYFKAR